MPSQRSHVVTDETKMATWPSPLGPDRETGADFVSHPATSVLRFTSGGPMNKRRPPNASCHISALLFVPSSRPRIYGNAYYVSRCAGPRWDDDGFQCEPSTRKFAARIRLFMWPVLLYFGCRVRGSPLLFVSCMIDTW